MRNLKMVGGVCVTALFVGLVFLLILAQLGLIVFLVWKMVSALVAGKVIEGLAWGAGVLVVGLLGRSRRSD